METGVKEEGSHVPVSGVSFVSYIQLESGRLPLGCVIGERSKFRLEKRNLLPG